MCAFVLIDAVKSFELSLPHCLRRFLEDSTRRSSRIRDEALKSPRELVLRLYCLDVCVCVNSRFRGGCDVFCILSAVFSLFLVSDAVFVEMEP